MSTVRGWLDARRPAPPPALLARAREVLGDEAGLDAAPAPDVFLSTAESLLARMLRDGCETRGSALELLVADALVTWAFEAAAEGSEPLAPLAHEAMGRIAALAVATAERGA